MQTGLECIGDIDLYDIFEVVYLGAKSLASVSEDFSLDISDMAIFSAILDSASDDEMFKKEITRLISEKNRHEALALCEKYSLDKESTGALVGLIGMYGEMSRVLEMLLPICKSEKAKDAYNRLATLCTLLSSTEYASKIKLDFSVVNDMNYYNGIVFKGFLNGIPEGVLSGGEYGTLMRKMGRRSDAIGFALYLDTLEALDKSTRDFDVDVLLIYNDSTDASCIIEAKNKLIAQGKSVSAQKAIPQKLRYKELIDLTEGK
jgi:ATP phosphoribosyltransferase regulatory subunit